MASGAGPMRSHASLGGLLAIPSDTAAIVLETPQHARGQSHPSQGSSSRSGCGPHGSFSATSTPQHEGTGACSAHTTVRGLLMTKQPHRSDAKIRSGIVTKLRAIKMAMSRRTTAVYRHRRRIVPIPFGFRGCVRYQRPQAQQLDKEPRRAAARSPRCRWAVYPTVGHPAVGCTAHRSTQLAGPLRFLREHPAILRLGGSGARSMRIPRGSSRPV